MYESLHSEMERREKSIKPLENENLIFKEGIMLLEFQLTKKDVELEKLTIQAFEADNRLTKLHSSTSILDEALLQGKVLQALDMKGIVIVNWKTKRVLTALDLAT